MNGFLRALLYNPAEITTTSGVVSTVPSLYGGTMPDDAVLWVANLPTSAAMLYIYAGTSPNSFLLQIGPGDAYPVPLGQTLPFYYASSDGTTLNFNVVPMR